MPWYELLAYLATQDDYIIGGPTSQQPGTKATTKSGMVYIASNEGIEWRGESWHVKVRWNRFE